MDQRQQQLRHAAAKAFIESLDQLHETLQTADRQPVQLQKHTASEPDTRPLDKFDLSSFEQAAADIEQFMERMRDEG